MWWCSINQPANKMNFLKSKNLGDDIWEENWLWLFDTGPGDFRHLPSIEWATQGLGSNKAAEWDFLVD